MIHLLIVILDDVKRLPNLLKVWRAAGVPGVTILTSAGGYRVRTWLEGVGLGALDRLFESAEVQRRTLLVAVEGEHLLERAIAEAERSGHPIGFGRFLRYGLGTTAISMLLATGYVWLRYL